jgi:hypothetical protein
MKTFRKIGIALMAMIACVGISACGDDDDDDDDSGSSSNSSTTSGFVVSGSKLSLSNGYYWNESGTMHIEFYNFSLTGSKYPSKFNYLSIDYPCTTDAPQTAVIPSRQYSIYVVKDQTASSDGFQGECEGSDDKSDLQITRNGNKYTIVVDYANGLGGEDQFDTDFNLSINWTGSLSELPSDYRN